MSASSPITVADVDPSPNGKVTNLRIGVFELVEKAVCADTIDKGKDLGYSVDAQYGDYPALIEKYNRLKDQVRNWSRDHIKLVMVDYARTCGIQKFDGTTLMTWTDFLETWSLPYTRQKKPSKELRESVAEVLFGYFMKKKYWNETFEKLFLEKFNWTYTDEHIIDKTQHLGKSKGAKIKTSIAKLIATAKAELIKEVNRAGKRSHGITLNAKLSPSEVMSQGPKKRGAFVCRVDGEVVDLTDIDDKDERPEVTPVTPFTPIKQEKPNILGLTNNGFGSVTVNPHDNTVTLRPEQLGQMMLSWMGGAFPTSQPIMSPGTPMFPYAPSPHSMPNTSTKRPYDEELDERRELKKQKRDAENKTKQLEEQLAKLMVEQERMKKQMAIQRQADKMEHYRVQHKKKCAYFLPFG